MAVSKKDLARVNLGKKRQEKIKVMALTKWKAKVPVGSTIYNHGQEKPLIEYVDKDVVRSDDYKMRSSADKVALFHVKRSDNFADYADTPEQVAAKARKVYVPKEYKPTPDSPFKRAAQNRCAKPVVIERK